MNTIHWLENKQLDRVTNYSSRTECVRNILSAGGNIYYYCTFATQKVYYGLSENIIYLGFFRNKVLKHFEFPIRIVLKALELVIRKNRDILMVNQDLVEIIKMLW